MKTSFDENDALVIIALLSAAAGAIHAAVIQEHLREWWLYGTFFAVSAAAQLIWTVLVLRRPSRSILIIGVIGNAALVVLWLVTRVTGLPFGPEPWTPEGFGLLDVVASIFEAALVVSSILVLRRSELPDRTSVRLERPQIAVFCGAVIAITYIAIQGGGH
jgi:MFS family permease